MSTLKNQFVSEQYLTGIIHNSKGKSHQRQLITNLKARKKIVLRFFCEEFMFSEVQATGRQNSTKIEGLKPEPFYLSR